MTDETQKRLRFVADASRILGSSLDLTATLESVARLAVPILADWCVVHLVEQDGSIRQIAVAHVDPARVQWALELQRRFPPDPRSTRGVPHVIRTGAPELYPEIPDSLLQEAAIDAEHLQILREVGMRSAMIVPMEARGRALGAITLVSTESGRRFDHADLELALDLARRAAVAVDNAALYRDVQEEVAERARAEEKIRFQADLLNAIKQAVIATDLSGRVIYWNRQAESLYGWRAEDAYGQRIMTLTPSEASRSQAEEIMERLRRGESWSGEVELQRRDGVVFPGAVSLSPVFGPDGRQEGIIGVSMDISETRRLESELRTRVDDLARAEERMRSVIDNVIDGIITISDDGRIQTFNRAAEAIFGYSADEVTGKNVSLLMPEPYHSEHDTYLRNYLDTGRARIIGIGREVTGRRKDGSTFPMELAVGEFWLGNQRHFTGIVRDISERKRARAEIETLNTRLQRAMTETHHRVKNNLQIITAMVDMTLIDHPASVPTEELQRLGTHVRTLAEVHELLTHQAKNDAEATGVSGKELLERLLPLLQTGILRRPLEFQADDVWLTARQGTSLALVANELVSNAVKYGAGCVGVRLHQKDGVATFEVWDDGPGFPPGFDPERQVSTGLELVNMLSHWDLGGRVRYRNRAEGGAHVVITMSVTKPSPA